jgi:hypothetical protein
MSSILHLIFFLLFSVSYSFVFPTPPPWEGAGGGFSEGVGGRFLYRTYHFLPIAWQLLEAVGLFDDLATGVFQDVSISSPTLREVTVVVVKIGYIFQCLYCHQFVAAPNRFGIEHFPSAV